jgi:hypothetical protein
VTVDMITKLQPHFLSIWTFQSWNLTYNVSVEWDAPEDKYEWIKRGIKFVQEGVKKNNKSPDLIWDTAWYYYHKIGFSDESIILRRLFYDDEDESFKKSPLDGNVYRDNFQLGHDWFVKAVRLVDDGESRQAAGPVETVEHVDAPAQRKGRQGDLPFRSMPAHAQTRYAIGLEKESMKGIEATFGPKAQNEWQKALDEWTSFGTFVFDTFNEVEVDGKLTHQKVRIDDNAITSPEINKKLHENQRYWANRWADQMNYPYWKDRCAAEMEPEGAAARKLFYDGTRAYKSADFPQAVEKFREGLQIWSKVLDHHLPYSRDDLNKKDTGLVVKRYARACQQSGTEMPLDTPFYGLAKTFENDNTKDPFDALEMLDNSTRNAKGAPKPPR